MAQTLESHLTAQSEDARRLFWHRLRWDAVRRYLPEGEFTLLDIGAGAGHLAQYLAADRPASRYAFIEPIAPLREQLRKRHGEDADFADRPSFEGVRYAALLDVLEHQQDDVGFLRDLAKRLEPGAKLIITVPALSVLWSAWDVGLGHHRRYRKGTLAPVVRAAGFQLDELSYLFPELLLSGVYRRFRNPAGGATGATTELEMPTPPTVVNEALYGIGWVSQKLRRLHPVGTSLLAVAVRR